MSMFLRDPPHAEERSKSASRSMTPAETHSPSEYEALLRADFASFAQQCFHELNPCTLFAAGWFHDIIAAKLEAVRTGRSRHPRKTRSPRPRKRWCNS